MEIGIGIEIGVAATSSFRPKRRGEIFRQNGTGG